MSVQLTPHELEKVRECLDTLQRAQLLIDEAAQHLCPVKGFAEVWSSLSKTHDQVKAAWYRVDKRRMALATKGG